MGPVKRGQTTSESKRTLYYILNVQGKTNDEVWNPNNLTLHWTNTKLVSWVLRWWRRTRPAKSSEARNLNQWWGLYQSVHILSHGSKTGTPSYTDFLLYVKGSFSNTKNYKAQLFAKMNVTSPYLTSSPLPHLHLTRQAHECQCSWHGFSGWQTRSMTLPLQPQRSIARIYGN